MARSMPEFHVSSVSPSTFRRMLAATRAAHPLLLPPVACPHPQGFSTRPVADVYDKGEAE